MFTELIDTYNRDGAKAAISLSMLYTVMFCAVIVVVRGIIGIFQVVNQ